MLYLICLNLLLEKRKSEKFNLAYSTILFALVTIGNAGNIWTDQVVYIDNRNFPGGPNAFGEVYYSLPVTVMGFAAFILATWMQDGFLLYRFLLLWNFNYYMFIIPLLMYLASVAFGCILLFSISQPGASLWTTTTVPFALIYWSISISLNIILTTLIAGRLLWIRHSIREVLGEEHTRTLTSVAAMLVESSSLYTVIGIAFLITYRIESSVQNLIIPTLGVVQSISPQLIIYRVIRGRGWSRSTAALTGPISFATNTMAEESRMTGMTGVSTYPPSSLPSSVPSSATAYNTLPFSDKKIRADSDMSKSEQDLEGSSSDMGRTVPPMVSAVPRVLSLL
ncbi:hypothetical protein SISSUDRAFT_993197 [Sistotremastrum suecicum HHB10207 ss-3]|uniref:Uncharacterized protein n=1 Tax=Sistotremastrum suecicum HHB10207 ss-3 TaxID=1314776 RepID=A0A165YJQ3_9AGAM|nr:hypothetical protein SISSUDRAFT_993197 [Sistotremastrum suecicum HHB10207 ss-3]